MNNLDTLKQELITQKEQIERMSGVVRVAGTNPSPSEITAGIKTIPSSDLTMSTATEADVKQGKTFFSGNSELKTGTAIIDSESIHHLFMTDYSTISAEEPVYYACPNTLKVLRRYLFYYNYNPIHFTFGDSILEIEDYTFSQARNMVFYNFENLTNLTRIGSSAFSYCGTEGLSFEFPDSLQRIYGNAFYNTMFNGATIKFPKNLTSLGTYAFYQEVHKTSCYLNIDETALSTLPYSCLYNIAFINDLILPTKVTTLGDNFNSNGCFPNIYLHSQVTELKNNCFGGSASYPLSNFYLRSVVFERESPPTIGTKVFASQNITNGFKIYVPDNAVEAYKAVANLSYCASCIYPISEKD